MTGNTILVVFIAGAFAAATAGLACGREPNIHQTQEAQSKACVDCHTSAYRAATNPKHDGVFEETCNDCHKTTAWTPIPDLHSLDAVEKQECVGCHKKDYDATTQPVHAPIFPTDCKDCHGTDKFQPTARDIHTTKTFSQHVCYDCHKQNYDLTTNPNHKQLGYPTTCESCHNTGGAWVPTKTGG